MNANEKDEATARPWWFAQHDEWGRYDIGQGDVAIFRSVFQADSGPGEAPITEARDEHARANAALVVRAVNAHDALVAALTAIVSRVEEQDGGPCVEITSDDGTNMVQPARHSNALDGTVEHRYCTVCKARTALALARDAEPDPEDATERSERLGMDTPFPRGRYSR